MFIENKYNKIYFSMLENARNRDNTEKYLEKHHIIPKSLGGNNTKENIVLLTAREHFIAHLLLPKFLIKKEHVIKMNWALARFCNKSKHMITSRQYEMIRKMLSKQQKGYKHKSESIEKIKQSKIGNKNPAYGKPGYNKGKKFVNYPKELHQKIHSKNWIIIKPNKEEIEIFNLKEYCRENNLNYHRMIEITYGKQKQHKGYSLRRKYV